jgi:hypothetical protein
LGQQAIGSSAKTNFWFFVLGLLCLPQRLVCAGDVVEFSHSDQLQKGESRIDARDLRRHVTTLSSDAFEGREAGGRGGKAALAYLRSELKAIRQNGSLPRESTQDFGREYQNLLVLLPGSDERLKREVVIVGAHYDHVGYGNAKNSAGPIGFIHNGADDNASGTSAVLELIEAFSSLETAPARSILFAFWDAEEAGLLGSKHWVSYPTIPLHDIRFVMNIDMLGRLRDNRLVTVGWRSAPGLRSLLVSHNTDNELKLAFQPKVIADSDHYYFYAAGIPAVHIDTDKHEDYHRPSDDPEKINWSGLLAVTHFAYRVIDDVANRSEIPQFRREALKESAPGWMTTQPAVSPPIRFGVNWDPELAKKNIAQVAQLTPDSPAAIAGLRVGDRITRLGPWENGTFEDLKTTMQIVSNPVLIRVNRAGVEVPFDVRAHFWGSPIRLGAGWIEDPALPNCVAVTHVMAESPADRGGLVAGDVILEMGGHPISSADEFKQRVIDESGPLHLRVERQGRIRDIKIDLFDRSLTNLGSAIP